MQSMETLGDRLIKISETCARLACSRSSLYMLMERDETFPKPIRLSVGAVRFSLAEIEAWLSRQPRGVGPARGRKSPGRFASRPSASGDGEHRGTTAKVNSTAS
jgi:predicted DNA-binding transcriptional regulator AlpA